MCVVLIGAGLLLGGGARNGLLGDTVVQLVAVPLVLIAVRHAARRGFDRFSQTERVVVAGLFLLPLLQLVPLPSALWTGLPNAAPRLAAFHLVAQAPDGRPISLAPEATALGVLSLVPPVALFLGARSLPPSQRRILVLVVLAIAIASAFLGMAQLAGGDQSPLRFYAVTNTADAVGFFANRNHFSAFLYVSMMLTAPWALDSLLGMLDERHDAGIASARLIVAFASGTLMFILAVAQIMTRSRAGVALSLLAAIGIAVLVVGDSRNRWRKTSLILFAVAIAAAVLFAAQFGIDRFIDRLSVDPRGDARLAIARHTLDAAIAFLPFGSGIGSFQTVYGLWEVPADLIAAVYINQAHDDVLQIALEAGVPGLLLLFVFVVWLLSRAVVLFGRRGGGATAIEGALRRGALIAIVLLLLHSLVDYPLRASANMILFALCCAMIGTPIPTRAAAFADAPFLPDRRPIRVSRKPV